MDSVVNQEVIGIALGFVLTLMIYSYLLGDNPVYRIAVHVLVGVGVGYAAAVLIYSVLIPQLISPLLQLSTGGGVELSEQLQLLVVTALAVFLLLKLSPRTATLGNIAMAFVMGVGGAVAVGGAALGTLLPQINAAALSLIPGDQGGVFPGMGVMANLLAVLIMLTGTITTLLYFHFGASPSGEDDVEQPRWLKIPAQIGQVFLMVAFGSLYAGGIISSLSILTERVQFLLWVPQEIIRLLGSG